MRNRALTLAETLVVVSILMLAAALLTPVVLRAKEASKQSACASNLQQLHLFTSIYRERYDGSSLYGNCAAMGLPPHLGAVHAEFDTPRKIHECSGYPSSAGFPAAYVYKMVCEGPFYPPEKVREWQAYSREVGEKMILYIDRNHNTPAAQGSPHMNNLYIGVYLDGQLRKFIKRGDSTTYEFWKE